MWTGVAAYSKTGICRLTKHDLKYSPPNSVIEDTSKRGKQK